jgi:hypothetical protein
LLSFIFLDVSLIFDCNNGFGEKLFQISDDAKNGLYVENLTEEYVTSFEDVTQILIKVCNTFGEARVSSCSEYIGIIHCFTC